MSMTYRRQSALFAMFAVLMFFRVPVAGAQSTEEEGFASWYNRGDQRSRTASGEIYDNGSLTGAHPSLPFDTMVRVTRLDDRRTIVVRINDRMVSGPEHIIDLSGAAAERLGLLDSDVARVHIQALKVRSIVPLAGNKIAESRPQLRKGSTQRKDTGLSKAKAQPDRTVKDVLATGYTLQIGVFSTRKAAKKFAIRFKNSWIADVSVKNGRHYRVYYNRFTQERPARIAQKALQKRGQDSFLRVISP